MRKHPLGRRDFLKLTALLSAGALGRFMFPAWQPRRARSVASKEPGVIVLLLDTLTSRDMSIYGYPRATTPNIEKHLGRFNVYHDHHSTASFTSPGTSSLLTGLYPWSHRAFTYEGIITKDKISHNIFDFIGADRFRLGYGQNPWADLLLDQFESAVDQHVSLDAFNLRNKDPLYRRLLTRDAIAAQKSLDSFVFEANNDASASSVLGLGRKLATVLRREIADRKFSAEYPLGIPNVYQEGPYVLEDLFDGVMGLIAGLPPSAFAYLHLFPPHYPCLPKSKFLHAFDQGWQPVSKSSNYFGLLFDDQAHIEAARLLYDAYIASVDEEVGRLFDFMAANDVFEKNYVILTSDHGDIYERGLTGHSNPTLYAPLIHIPLLISSPRQSTRLDVHSPTSSIDVLPTLLNLLGKKAPSDLEGRLLPGFGGESDPARPIFSIDCKSSPAFGPIKDTTIAMRKGDHKLIGYFYDDDAGFELFNMKNDPEELENIYDKQEQVALELSKEMRAKLVEINAPYTHGP